MRGVKNLRTVNGSKIKSGPFGARWPGVRAVSRSSRTSPQNTAKAAHRAPEARLDAPEAAPVERTHPRPRIDSQHAIWRGSAPSYVASSSEERTPSARAAHVRLVAGRVTNSPSMRTKIRRET